MEKAKYVVIIHDQEGEEEIGYIGYSFQDACERYSSYYQSQKPEMYRMI